MIAQFKISAVLIEISSLVNQITRLHKLLWEKNQTKHTVLHEKAELFDYKIHSFKWIFSLEMINLMVFTRSNEFNI